MRRDGEDRGTPPNREHGLLFFAAAHSELRRRLSWGSDALQPARLTRPTTRSKAPPRTKQRSLLTSSCCSWGYSSSLARTVRRVRWTVSCMLFYCSRERVRSRERERSSVTSNRAGGNRRGTFCFDDRGTFKQVANALVCVRDFRTEHFPAQRASQACPVFAALHPSE